YLRAQLTVSTRQLLALYTGPAPPSTALLQALADDLTTVIKQPGLYDPARFAQVAVAPATLALALNAPTVTATVSRLNRALLEEAYPVELADRAFALISGELRLERCTVLGRGHAHRLWASEC